jgi:hypothetical protein
VLGDQEPGIEIAGGQLAEDIGDRLTRFADFTASMEKVKAMPEGADKDAWLKSTQANIDFHANEIAQREADLAVLTDTAADAGVMRAAE